jgi:hypothetical protein
VNRDRIETFDLEFVELHLSRADAARRAGNELIYRTEPGHETELWPISTGTLLIRSAAAVEQMINGITVRLWDDPFEWTLPERLPTVENLFAYFEEVETIRKRGFAFLKSVVVL